MINLDAVPVAVILKDSMCEVGTIVGGDVMWHVEQVDDARDELDD